MDTIAVLIFVISLVYVIRYMQKILHQGERSSQKCNDCNVLDILNSKANKNLIDSEN